MLIVGDSLFQAKLWRRVNIFRMINSLAIRVSCAVRTLRRIKIWDV